VKAVVGRQLRPRVIVLEYQEQWGPLEAKTRPYATSFQASHVAHMGASLLAFVKLLQPQGYRLVGCHSGGYNAFFLKEGLGDPELPSYPIENCFVHQQDPKWGNELEKRREIAKQVVWIDV